MFIALLPFGKALNFRNSSRQPHSPHTARSLRTRKTVGDRRKRCKFEWSVGACLHRVNPTRLK